MLVVPESILFRAVIAEGKGLQSGTATERGRGA